ncbi:hypothetical protein B0A55_03257 [Friedmanniomyces simplex]|uniref:BTB domain-containing protein n=1 Tax=Friedmanniomyces simplex TaxID=329884 RepID=A0A4U0XGN1_9PEZI|nr:hypothetical protein B0A55_04561 [Friedmanniomyces simplex]TKA76140.1 hypothetical protein B0A55_03257 [Friedmanniomyces simplex]
MESFIQSLESAKRVKIIVGRTVPRTFVVQQLLLESKSEYFVEALQAQHLSTKPEAGLLIFADDDPAALEMLLFWMYKGHLPKDALRNAVIHGVRAWALGNRLGLPDIQNWVMLAMVRWSYSWFFDTHTLREAVKSSAPGSLMRKVLAEETIVQPGSRQLQPAELGGLDGHGFLDQVLEMHFAKIGDLRQERGLDDDG